MDLYNYTGPGLGPWTYTIILGSRAGTTDLYNYTGVQGLAARVAGTMDLCNYTGPGLGPWIYTITRVQGVAGRRFHISVSRVGLAVRQ